MKTLIFLSFLPLGLLFLAARKFIRNHTLTAERRRRGNHR